MSSTPHTPADGLPQEGPTADKCEKGGRLMSDPFFPFRKEAEIYFRSCENLLSAATAPPPFSQQELAMIGHYVAEVQKLVAVSAKK